MVQTLRGGADQRRGFQNLSLIVKLTIAAGDIVLRFAAWDREIMREIFITTTFSHEKFGRSMSFAIHSQSGLLLSQREVEKGDLYARDVPQVSQSSLLEPPDRETSKRQFSRVVLSKA